MHVHALHRQRCSQNPLDHRPQIPTIIIVCVTDEIRGERGDMEYECLCLRWLYIFMYVFVCIVHVRHRRARQHSPQESGSWT